MFEKCGILDVLYRAYRNKFFILVVTASFLLVGVALMLSGKMDASAESESQRGMWVASACYLVNLDPSVDVGEATVDQIKDKEASMAATYSAVLSSDFSRERIYDRLLSQYTKEEIIKNLDLNVSVEDLTAFSLSKVFTSSVLEQTSIVNFYVKAKQRAFAQVYLDECHAIFNETIPMVKDSTICYIDGVLDRDFTDAKSVGSLGKLIVPLMAILGFVLSMLVVFAQSLFAPTVNRRSDFCAYDLPVIGEVSLSTIKEVRKA